MQLRIVEFLDLQKLLIAKDRNNQTDFCARKLANNHAKIFMKHTLSLESESSSMCSIFSAISWTDKNTRTDQYSDFNIKLCEEYISTYMVGSEPSFQPRLVDNDLVVYRFHFSLWQHIPLIIFIFLIRNQHIKQAVISNCMKKLCL